MKLAVAAVPKEAVSVYNHALDLSNKGDYHPALAEYKKAIEMHPMFIEAYNNIGEIYSKMGDADNAISSYLDALKIDRHYRVLLNLGVEYFNKGQYIAALGHFQESVSIDDNFIEGHFYAGMVEFNLKEYENSEKNFLKVVKLDKKHLKANYLLAYIYYEWKQYKKALKCLDRIKDIADDVVFVKKYYGFCYFYLGDYDKACEYLSSALESSPKYAEFKDYLKSLTVESKLKEIGDVKARIQEMEEKIMESPELHDYTHLSMLYIFQGEYKKAEELLLSVQ